VTVTVIVETTGTVTVSETVVMGPVTVTAGDVTVTVW
jgi:flagellar basal body P-ring protein FlgI